MKNKKERISLRENLNLIIRGLKLYATFPKPTLLAKILQATYNSLCPFLNIYLSALILNELTGERNSERLIFLAILTVVLNLIAIIIRAIVNQWSWYCLWEAWRVPYKAFTDKLFSMDYADLENNEIQEQYSKVFENVQTLGFGLPKVYSNYDQIISGIIQIIVSVVMAFSMFSLTVPDGSPYAWLDSPLVALSVVVALALSVFLAPYISAKV